MNAEQRRPGVARGEFDDRRERVGYVAAALDEPGQLVDCRCCEEPFEWNVPIECGAQITGQRDGGDGTSTEIEESSVRRDAFDGHVEMPREECGDGLRDRPHRCHELGRGCVGARQCCAVDLARGRERHRVDDGDARGPQVAWEVGGDASSQAFDRRGALHVGGEGGSTRDRDGDGGVDLRVGE